MSGSKKKVFRPFYEARAFVRSLKFPSRTEYLVWLAAHRPGIPSSPDAVYADEWISWYDFLGKVKSEKKPLEESSTAAKEAAKRAKHCNDVAAYAKSLGKTMRWATEEEADEAAVEFSASRGYLIESFLCDKCAQWHVQRAVGTIIGDDQASDHAETRPTYAERRQAGMISNTSVHALFP